MTTTCTKNLRAATISLGLATMLLLAASALGQDRVGGQNNQPVIQDWTTHHVVFSDPGTASDAIREGQYDRWLRIVNDPRYLMQQRRRSIQASHPAGARSTSKMQAPQTTVESQRNLQSAVKGIEMTLEERDALRGGNRSLPSGLMRALILAPVVINGDGPPGPPIQPNLMSTDWSENMNSGATVGLGDFPATYSTGGTDCNDFAIFNTGLTGSSGQASIIAYNNLYPNCNMGNSPTAYWAYNTNGGTITNAVDLSVDGSQVAMVQSDSSGHAVLVLLKWKANDGSLSSPHTLTPVSMLSQYRTCTAPCMAAISLSGTPSDTYSFPFYDYGSNGADDTVYVGDDGGALHKFTGVFLGTPAEAGTPWPVTVFPGTAGESALGSPVYDPGSGKVFVGDYLLNSFSTCEPSANGTDGKCGYLYSVNSTSGAVVKSQELDYNIGILDSPLLDASAGTVYAFVGDDGSTNCTASGPCAGVFQFPVSFASGAAGTEATVGAGYEFMMSGAFDNTYYNSNDATGHLYVVGNTGPADNTLYQIPINSGTMGTPVPGPVVSTNYDNSYYAAGLQVTEFYNTNTSTDNIFLSVLAYGRPTTGYCGTAGVNNGCVMGFNVTNGPIGGSTNPTGALSEAGGTSGIVVDNAAAGASNIYFSTLLNAQQNGQTCSTSGGNGGCAIQTLQSAP